MPEPDPPRRPAWWRPGVGHAAQRDIGGAIYGLILATSLIAVSREYIAENAGVTAITVVVTAVVFWLAHVYAGVLALELRERHFPTRGEIRAILDKEWPLVQAGILPTIILLLGPLGLLADETAQDVALAACLMELALTGVVAARAGGASGVLVAVSGAISLSFGVAVIALKVFVH